MSSSIIGAVLGYLIASMLYGELLPALSIPAIVGVVIGGVATPLVGLLVTVIYGSDPEAEMHRKVRENTYDEFHRTHTDSRARVGALKDADPLVREVAARSLGAEKDVNAVETLLSTLEVDTDLHDRSEIIRNIKALGAIGDKRAIEPLMDFSKHASDPGIRKAALKAVRRIEQPIQD